MDAFGALKIAPSDILRSETWARKTPVCQGIGRSIFAWDSIKTMHWHSTDWRIGCTCFENLRSIEKNRAPFMGELVFKKCACGNIILSFSPWRSLSETLPLSKWNPQIRVTFDQDTKRRAKCFTGVDFKYIIICNFGIMLLVQKHKDSKIIGKPLSAYADKCYECDY